MGKNLMIDYRNENGGFVRKVIDNFEFCIREGNAYFYSNGERFEIPIQNISQVYTF